MTLGLITTALLLLRHLIILVIVSCSYGPLCSALIVFSSLILISGILAIPPDIPMLSTLPQSHLIECRKCNASSTQAEIVTRLRIIPGLGTLGYPLNSTVFYGRGIVS